MDMNEFRARKQFQQQLDPAGVRGRFEDQRLAVLECELGEKPANRGAPLRDFVLGRLLERKKAVIMLGTARERPTEIRRAKNRQNNPARGLEIGPLVILVY